MHRTTGRASPLVSLLLGVGLTLGTLLMFAGLAVLAYGHYGANRIYYGVSVQGVPVGGLLRYEALARLERALTTDELPYLRLRTPDAEWIYSSADLGGYLLLEESVEEAWQLGRGGVFRHDMLMRAQLLWRGYDIVPAFDLEPGLSLAPLRQIARQEGRPPRTADIRVAGLHIGGEGAQVGRDLDMAASQAAIVAAVRQALGQSRWHAEPVWLRTRYNRPPVTGYFPVDPISVDLVFVEVTPPLSELSEARETAETILSGPVTLHHERPALGGSPAQRMMWTIDQAMLGAWLSVQTPGHDQGAADRVVLDVEAIEAFVAELSRGIDRPARQGRFGYDPATQTLEVLSSEQYGFQLDQELAVAMIVEACLRAEDRSVALPVAVRPPAVTHQALEEMLPLELVSVGETSFVGSSDERLHNIVVATGQFEGLVVPAGGRFSMVEQLGLVTAANGYTESWIIYGNETLLGPGGGVCQVATTLFRAAFWGGLPIVERTPHAYRVSWYEPPLGLDAAVFTPWVDVKFDNDHDTPLLILTEVDRAAGKLYFRLYGRPSGRSVEMEGPILGPPTSPGEPVLEEDPALAPGQRVQVEQARDGIRVTVYRLIFVEDQQIARERFFSDYKAWPARYRVGPTPGAGDAGVPGVSVDSG